MMPQPKILFQLSGSIAAFKACTAISHLVQSGAEVRIAATEAALRFIGEATLEGLSGNPIFKDIYEPGRMMDHIHLAKWADLAIVYPASANTVNALAAGLTTNTVGALFLAWDHAKPYWIAPAMNHAMWDHPTTQLSLTKLKGWGIKVLEPATGRQACGDFGVGRLVEPEETALAILRALDRGER